MRQWLLSIWICVGQQQNFVCILTRQVVAIRFASMCDVKSARQVYLPLWVCFVHITRQWVHSPCSRLVLFLDLLRWFQAYCLLITSLLLVIIIALFAQISGVNWWWWNSLLLEMGFSHISIWVSVTNAIRWIVCSHEKYVRVKISSSPDSALTTK